MKKQRGSRKLNRYTSLPVLLDLLRRRKLVLVDPSMWEDRNDAKVILEYKRKKKISSLFAACFGIGDETIHHWKSYADGIAGCCVEFDEKKLLDSFDGIPELTSHDVDYKTTSEVETTPIKLDSMPFTKRWPYRCDNEFRVIWQGETDATTIALDIEMDSIERITLSQKMYPVVRKSVKELLREASDGSSIKVTSSTLYENKRWIDAFRNE